MMGLARRLWYAITLAIWQWRDDRRDARLLRDFLRFPTRREHLKARMTPTTRLFVLMLERFVQSDLGKMEFRCDGYTVSCLNPFELRLAVSAAVDWEMLLRSVSRFLADRNGFREHEISFATQEAPITLYCAWAKPPADPFAPDELENWSERPLIVLSKSRLD